jgi:hypothetical protein
MLSEWCFDSLMLRNIKSAIVGGAETDLNFHTNLDRYAGFIQDYFVYRRCCQSRWA